MIKVTRLGAKGGEVAVNAELIELVEETPDTVITLTSGDKLIVRESMDEVIERVLDYKRQIVSERPRRGRSAGTPPADSEGAGGNG